MTNNTKTTNRNIDGLKPNPFQAEIFGVPDAEGIRELAEDIQRRGLQHPIVILSDGTIMSGHRRLAACKLLELPTVDVIVRVDLVDDPAAAFDFFLRENTSHRKMTKLQIVRAYQALADSIEHEPYKCGSQKIHVNYRQRLAALLGCSPRNTQRWIAAASAPLEIQAALEAGHLLLNDAARVMTLAESCRDEIVAAIRNGRDPKSVVAEVLAGEKPKQVDPARVLRNLIATISEAAVLFAHPKNDVPDHVASAKYTDALDNGIKLLRSMASWNSKAIKRSRQDSKPVGPFQYLHRNRAVEEDGIS